MNKKYNQYTIASVEIPDMPLVPGSIAARKAILKHEADIYYLNKRYIEWEQTCWEIARQDNTDYSSFLSKVVTGFLIRNKGTNAILSPLSIFHALAVMADLTEGNTQREILSVMGFSNISEVRNAISIQYRANLAHGGAEIKPAAMLWFDKTVTLDHEKIQDMAKSVYTGTCQGRMSDADYQAAVSSWLNETINNNMPSENRMLDIDENTKLVLLTTLYFHDMWENEFVRSKTKSSVFHALSGDVDTRYMRQSKWKYICHKEAFTAVPLSFEGGNTMWFVLPEDGLLPEDILNKKFFTSFPFDWRQMEYRDVHMEIPRFDISMNLDMIDSLRDTGLRQLFSDASQTPYTTINGKSIKVDQVKHNAKIKIDEQGCEASAYTVMRAVAAGGIPETPPRLDFILNRPFLFVLMGRGNLPLFTGIIHKPEVVIS